MQDKNMVTGDPPSHVYIIYDIFFLLLDGIYRFLQKILNAYRNRKPYANVHPYVRTVLKNSKGLKSVDVLMKLLNILHII